MQTGEMTTKDRQIERRWEQLHTWGPYGLLGISVVLAVAATGLHNRSVKWYLGWTLVGAAVVLQLWWHGTRSRRPGRGRIPSRAGTVYYVVRWALAFVLSWLNPFFAFYAASGYMDADELIPGRWQRLGLLASAVTVAGAQTGGMPFGSGVQWILFPRF